MDFGLRQGREGSVPLPERRRSMSIEPKGTSASDGALVGPLGMGRKRHVSLYRPISSRWKLPEEDEEGSDK